MSTSSAEIPSLMPTAVDSQAPHSYRVLARTYRPKRFQDIVGQDVFVRLISSALAQSRIGHGFLLTGIRGVGKTTSARLLAMAVNCHTPVQEGETFEPCGTCASCQGFLDNKNIDIVELDAASHTGVDDIRQLLDSCHYRPLLGRYKVFIIDEVHMLSKSAFNALLKTLEEPPEHVIFIFATTEVAKIPATVLSRCLRFDLRRVMPHTLTQYLGVICQKEEFSWDEDALGLIAQAGEGSVRDSLSILDQALNMSLQQNTRHVTSALVSDILGLGNTALTYDLLDCLLKEDGAGAIRVFREFYEKGGDPLVMLDEMGRVFYQLLCRLGGVQEETYIPGEREKVFLNQHAEHLSIPAVNRLWQMHMKGRQELLRASFPERCFEVLLIRFLYTLPLPTPDQLVEGRGDVGGQAPSTKGTAASQAGATSRDASKSPQKTVPEKSTPLITFRSFEDVIACAEERRMGALHGHMLHSVSVLSFAPGRIALALRKELPSTFRASLKDFLDKETGQTWVVDVRDAPVKETPAFHQKERENTVKQAVLNHPLIQEAQATFPEFRLQEIHPKD
jgi:DNA polymerase-3 subunit gamma/tau